MQASPGSYASYELVVSHNAVEQRRRSRGLAAAVSLSAGTLIAVVLSLRGQTGSFWLMRQRDALLGGPRGPREVAPPGKAARLPSDVPVVAKVRTADDAARLEVLSTSYLQRGEHTPERAAFHDKVLLDMDKIDKHVASWIKLGHMKCCVRKGSDLEEEVYMKYYDDFPLDPECIPGYHKVDDECLACDAGTYCPAKKDLIFQCPENMHSPIATAEETGCWCDQGFYGVDPSIFKGANCQPCPADKFCPGNPTFSPGLEM